LRLEVGGKEKKRNYNPKKGDIDAGGSSIANREKLGFK
jgi:hypothetical protein